MLAHTLSFLWLTDLLAHGENLIKENSKNLMTSCTTYGL